MDTVAHLKSEALHSSDLPNLAPGLPGHVQSPYSYAAQHSHHGSRANSIINVVTVAELTGDNTIKVQHQHIERVNAAGDGSSFDNERDPLDFPNPWSKIRHDYREYFAEFFGTMLLICFGNGVDCQVVLSNLGHGTYFSINVGWGVGVMIGIYIAGGISGGHLNPVVTIALAAFRGLSWKKVPGYALAQVLGAFCGSLIVQGLYSGALDAFEGGPGIRTFGGLNSTGGLLFTAPSDYASNAVCFFSEFFNTAVLIMMVFALSDKNNLPPPPGMAPIVFFFLILGIGCALGWDTAYCLNPARDLGPRLAALVGGYPGEIFTYRRAYWLWTPIIATTMGGLAGALTYDVFLYVGDDSWVNRPWGNMKKDLITDVTGEDDKAISFV